MIRRSVWTLACVFLLIGLGAARNLQFKQQLMKKKRASLRDATILSVLDFSQRRSPR